MNKRVSLVLVIAIVAGGTIFAAGTGERPSNVEPGRRLTADTTEVSITGTIAYRDDVPVLITNDGIFSLSARRGGLYSSDMEDGMEITVTGEQIAALEDNPSDADYHIFLDTAVVDGETYTFEDAGRSVGATNRAAVRAASTTRATARESRGSDSGRGNGMSQVNDNSRGGGNGPVGRR